MNGMKFKDAVEKCDLSQKIIYGTKSELFHIIESGDRDFNTAFSVDKKRAMVLGEMGTANLLNSQRI